MNAFATLAPVCLKTSEGDSATVSLYGAQVLSWKAMNGQEQLFLSPKAQLDTKGAIRGGIPVCFPQFNQRVLNDRALAKHGFARVATWRLVEQCENRVSLILEARDLTEETIAAWPFSFYARVQVTLGVRSLKVTFSVQNTDAQAWPFALALHTYLGIHNLDETLLSGLQEARYWDAVTHLNEPDMIQQPSDSVLRFRSETDRVYRQAARTLTLNEPNRHLRIEQSASFTETVVWNPGADLCAKLTDMPPDGYQHMLCVEAAKIDEPVFLQPGETWTGWQELILQPS